MSYPVGNLRNRIENNLKLSIPKSNETFIEQPISHPATAPVNTGERFNQLSVKNIMQKWENRDSFYELRSNLVTAPSAISSSPLNRKKNLLIQQPSISFSFDLFSPGDSPFISTSDRSQMRFAKISPGLQEREVSPFMKTFKYSNKNFYGLH